MRPYLSENQVSFFLFSVPRRILCILVEIRYDPKENSFQNAFLKFLAGDKMPSLETLANEPIMRKPKDNVYVGAVNAGIVLSSLGQPTGSMGYQTYMLNEEPRIEEIMVIGRPVYDESKGVKINPLLKNLPSNNNTSTGAFLPQTITLTPTSQQQQNMNTLSNLFRNAQTVPNLLNTAVSSSSSRSLRGFDVDLCRFQTTITFPQHIIDQLGAGTLTVTQASNNNDGIESATASAAAILSQLNEIVQGQQQQQQQTHQSASNYLSNELLATADPRRLQSEKVDYRLTFFDGGSDPFDASPRKPPMLCSLQRYRRQTSVPALRVWKRTDWVFSNTPVSFV